MAKSPSEGPEFHEQDFSIAHDGPAEILPPALEEVLENEGVDLNDPEVAHAVEVTLRQSYRGPLIFPPAFILSEYKEEFPEIVAKITQWTERQGHHRLQLERDDFDADQRRKDRSQIGALAVALTGLLAAAVVGIFGNPFVAGVIVIAAIGGPAAAIVLASRMGGEDQGQAHDSKAPRA